MMEQKLSKKGPVQKKQINPITKQSMATAKSIVPKS